MVVNVLTNYKVCACARACMCVRVCMSVCVCVCMPVCFEAMLLFMYVVQKTKGV